MGAVVCLRRAMEPSPPTQLPAFRQPLSISSSLRLASRSSYVHQSSVQLRPLVTEPTKPSTAAYTDTQHPLWKLLHLRLQLHHQFRLPKPYPSICPGTSNRRSRSSSSSSSSARRRYPTLPITRLLPPASRTRESSTYTSTHPHPIPSATPTAQLRRRPASQPKRRRLGHERRQRHPKRQRNVQRQRPQCPMAGSSCAARRRRCYTGEAIGYGEGPGQ